MNSILKYSLLGIAFFFLVSQQAASQSIPVGTWREHLPYHRAISVAASKDIIYCATLNSLFAYHKRDYSVSTLSKNNGLSDMGFSKLAYHPSSKTLLIAYSNANIDLVQDGITYNMADIKRQNLPFSKVINNITFRDDEAWLSCGFGIVVLNLTKKEFKQTYLIGPGGSYININDIQFFKDTVYAATQTGIYRAALSDYLPDYVNWNKWTDVPYPDSACNTLAFFYDKPFVNYPGETDMKDSLFYRKNGEWKVFSDYGYTYCHQLEVIGDKLLMTKIDFVSVLDSNLNMYRHIYDYSTGQPIQALVNPFEATIDDDGYVWIADNYVGLAYIYDQWAYELIYPNGPGSISTFHMAYGSGNVWVATGAYSSTWSMTFRKDGLYHFDGMTWKTISNGSDAALDTIADLVCVAIDPSDPDRVFAGSWDKGLVQLKQGKVNKVYDQTNSSLSVLENNALGMYKVAVGGISFDQNGNLWVSNSGVTRSLSVLKPNGVWHSFDISSADMKLNDRVLGKIVIDRIGQKWVLIGRGYGIQVFNDNNTLTNLNDDKTANITSYAGRGALPSTLVTDMAIDLDGRLWIGSDKGIAVIYSPENVFSGYSYDAQQILVNQDGFDQYLLENETVTAIAVDGANRKWIGTEKSGVFLLSADGTKEIARFHEDNSPLLSNGIRSIMINDATGEVFFGTDKGIISYRSDATLAAETHSDVRVFPNPVEPGFEGAIAITGLVRDADIKIRNMAGEVVYATRSNGGEAVWSGKDLSGRRVATGVYIVFSSNAEGTETAAAKILFIK